jgi:4-carboxymuconolactone decarboxylase
MTNTTTMNAPSTKEMNSNLSAKEESIVNISAATAVGNMELLKAQLNVGLDAGLTINEIKDILVQLYAYCGFPRSLNGITNFMAVLEERKAKGIADISGKEASSITEGSDRYERGRKVIEELTKQPQSKPAKGVGEFAPEIDRFLKEHLFADIFDSDVLSHQQRELTTISALAAMTGTEGQLQAHLGMGMNTGLTEAQLSRAFALIGENINEQQAQTAIKVLTRVMSANH